MTMRQRISQPALSTNYQRFTKPLKSLHNEIFTANLCYYLYTSIRQKDTLNMHPRKSIKENRLETEGPLSEKDEVKKAEQRTMELQKKVDKKQPKKDKK